MSLMAFRRKARSHGENICVKKSYRENFEGVFIKEICALEWNLKCPLNF